MTRKKQKPADGTHIYLWDSEYEYVYGHVSAEEYSRILSEETGDDWTGTQVTHLYGRWELHGTREYDRYLEEYKEPGRGKFKITRNRWATEGD